MSKPPARPNARADRNLRLRDKPWKGQFRRWLNILIQGSMKDCNGILTLSTIFPGQTCPGSLGGQPHASELFHEQIQNTWFYRIQRRAACSRFAGEHAPSRLKRSVDGCGELKLRVGKLFIRVDSRYARIRRALLDENGSFLHLADRPSYLDAHNPRVRGTSDTSNRHGLRWNHFRCAFRASSVRFNCSSFCPASPSLPSAVNR